MIIIYGKKVVALIMMASREYYNMREMDNINPWKYIRNVAVELCTSHTRGMDPTNRFYSSMLSFIRGHVIFKEGESVSREEFLRTASMHMHRELGLLESGVYKMLVQNKGLLDVLLVVRLGASTADNDSTYTDMYCTPRQTLAVNV